MVKIKALKNEFEFLKNKVLGILLYGSAVSMNSNSDIDICIVNPEISCSEILKEVYHRVDVYGKRYDVKCFEELPLFLKWEVLNNHKVILTRDKLSLYSYFYYYRKLWQEQKHRLIVTKKELIKMLEH